MSPFLQSIMSRPRSNTTGTTPKTPGNSSPQASRIGAKHTSLTRRRESHDVADLRSPDNVGEKHLLFPFGTRHNDTHVETSMEAGPSYSLGMPSRSTAGRPPESNRRQTARRSTGRLPPLGSSKDTALSDNDVHDVPDSDDEHQVTSNLRRSPRKSVATLSRVDDKRVTTTSPTRGLGIGKGSSSSSAKKPQANPTYEVDDEPESITQFPSSPHGSPGRRKTEQRETRLPTASPQPTRLQPVVKRKDLMQRRDGSIPQREVSEICHQC